MQYFSDLKAKLIYVFRIPDTTHRDCVKIGEATFDDGDITLPPNSSALNKAAKERIEWFVCDLETARQSIAAAKSGKKSPPCICLHG